MDNGLVDADVVVIGAGALGLGTALHCALAGRSVVVVEQGLWQYAHYYDPVTSKDRPVNPAGKSPRRFGDPR